MWTQPIITPVAVITLTPNPNENIQLSSYRSFSLIQLLPPRPGVKSSYALVLKRPIFGFIGIHRSMCLFLRPIAIVICDVLFRQLPHRPASCNHRTLFSRDIVSLTPHQHRRYRVQFGRQLLRLLVIFWYCVHSTPCCLLLRMDIES